MFARMSLMYLSFVCLFGWDLCGCFLYLSSLPLFFHWHNILLVSHLTFFFLVFFFLFLFLKLYMCSSFCYCYECGSFSSSFFSYSCSQLFLSNFNVSVYVFFFLRHVRDFECGVIQIIGCALIVSVLSFPAFYPIRFIGNFFFSSYYFVCFGC